MLRLNGSPIITERFPNNETKVKDFWEKIRHGGHNFLEFQYVSDEELMTLMFVKKRLDEADVTCTLAVWHMPYNCKEKKIEGDLFTHPYTSAFINWLNFAKVEVMENNHTIIPDKEAAARYADNGYANLKLNGKQLTGAKDFDEYIVDGQNVLEFKYVTDEDLIALMFAKKRLDEANVPCRLFVWYMPYSRMDRKIEGDLFTLQYTCDFINWLNFEKVVVMEPHSDKTLNMLDRVSPIYPVKDWLPEVQQAMGFSENDHIVFPDKGAAARYADSGYANVCVLEKKRNPLTGNIEDMRLKEGKVNPGSKCIIIDDLCSKGGTFAWAGSILKSAGASEVVLVVSHCEETIFAGKLLTAESPISKVYTSTSIMCKEHANIRFMDVDVNNYVNH